MGRKPVAVSICVSLPLLIHAGCTRSAIRVDPISGIVNDVDSTIPDYAVLDRRLSTPKRHASLK